MILRQFPICITAIILCLITVVLPPEDAFGLPDETHPTSIATLTSEHFTVRFPENLRSYGQRTIEFAEYSYQLLTQKLQTRVNSKITIQLLDRTDVNESASKSYEHRDFFLIHLWPSQSILENAYCGDWLEIQISSQIARILVQNTGINFLYKLNNLVLPSWYLNGLSSYYRLPEVPSGGAPNNLYRAIVRNSAENNKIPQFNDIGSTHKSWLGRLQEKVYGSYFILHLIHEFGEDTLIRWNYANGSEISSINRIARDTFGKDFETLYEEWRDQQHRSVPPVSAPSKQLTQPWRHELPQIIPGQNAISYVREDGVHPRAIVVHDQNTRTDTEIIECKGRCEHHWSRDGQTLYFTYLIQSEHFQTERLYSIKSTEVVPHALNVPGHIRDFAVGDHALYITTLLTDTPEIYKLDFDHPEEARQIFVGEQFSLIEGLTELSDGQLAASVYSPESGQFDLVLFSDTGDGLNAFRLTHSKATEKYPFRISDDRIGYITERAGLYVLNEIRLDGTGSHILHIQPEAMAQAVMTPNRTIYYTEITADGMAIVRRNENQFSAGDLPEESSDNPVMRSVPEIQAEYNDGPDAYPWIPDTYSPMFGTSAATGWYLGLGISNSDILRHHSYHAHFAWYFDREMCDLELRYKWHRYKWYLAAGTSSRQRTQVIDLQTDYLYVPFVTYRANISTGTSWHFPQINIHFRTELLAEYSKSLDGSLNSIIESIIEQNHLDDDPREVQKLWSNALIAEIELSHIHDVPETIPGHTGYRLNFLTRIETPFFGNKYYTFINITDLDLSWSMPWANTNVFGIQLRYGFSQSESAYRYPLEITSSSQFSFNDGSIFYGIRSGNIIANNHLIYAHAQYTFPLAHISGKLTNYLVGLNRIGAGVHVDWAVKSNATFKMNLSDSVYGLGAELHIDAMLGYNYPFRFTLGYAKGIGNAAENAFYLMLGM